MPTVKEAERGKDVFSRLPVIFFDRTVPNDLSNSANIGKLYFRSSKSSTLLTALVRRWLKHSVT